MDSSHHSVRNVNSGLKNKIINPSSAKNKQAQMPIRVSQSSQFSELSRLSGQIRFVLSTFLFAIHLMKIKVMLFSFQYLLLFSYGRAVSEVVVLDSENFDRLTKDSVWFVNFYAPWSVFFNAPCYSMDKVAF